LAEAQLANGQFDQATTWTERTLELMNTEMWEEMYYESMIIKACIALERGDDEGAGAHFQRALRGAYDIENHFLFCRALIGLYDIMRRRKNPDAAILGIFLQERRYEVTMRDKQWLHRLSQAWPEVNDPVVRPVNSAAEIVRLIELSGLVEEDSPVQTNVNLDKSR
jgi:ATP/maltotriose-dependent transcriptional regulator MalT